MAYKDIKGQKFHRLTAKKYVGNNCNGRAVWLCKCDCGKEVIVLGSSLRDGTTKSCGCLNDEVRHKQKVQNPRKKERLYTIWKNMRQRCNNPRSASYVNYGARGISICEEWNNYENFRKWALENGYSDKLSIERKDFNGNYCPENCCWADNYIQSNNRRINVKYYVDGELLTVPQISRKYNISKSVVRSRLENKWSMKDTLEIPINGKPQMTLTYNGETHTIPEWAKKVGMTKGTLYKKLRQGKSLEDVLTNLRTKGKKLCLIERK